MRLTVLLLGVLVLSIPCYAATIYVQEGSAGTGASWAEAYGSLQDALDTAQFGYKILVAQGIYKPDTDGLADPREASFAMINGVTIEGGYAGYGADDPDERNVELYETILSGDLLGDDNPDTSVEDMLDDPTRSDNCYQIIYNDDNGLNDSAVLDGFIIIAGNADGHVPRDFGGGMYNSNSSPMVINCIFTHNSSVRMGGGMYNKDSSPTVINCIFSNNSTIEHGGGMTNADSNSTVTDCTFEGNWAVGGSHPMYGGGGGIHNNDSNLTLTNCTFNNNRAVDGGGIDNYYCSPAIINCAFTNNFATDDGGGMFIMGSVPKISDCIFVGNSSSDTGGGIFNFYGSPIFTNCTFFKNRAGDKGGGMSVWEGNPIVTNCILWGDRASSGGNELGVGRESTIDIDYCDVQGGQAAIYDDLSGNIINWGLHNISDNPIFIGAGNLRLAQGSPCIDKGNDHDIIDVVTDEIHDYKTSGSQTIELVKKNIDPFTVYLRGWIRYDEPKDYVVWQIGEATFIDIVSTGLIFRIGDQPLLVDYIFLTDITDDATDLDGNERIVDGDGDGEATVDMGAYEFKPNTAPVADAGEDETVGAGEDCTAIVTLDGSGSTDADGDELTYRWYYEGELFGEGVEIEANLGLGVHEFTLIVDDGKEESETDEVVITVVDNTPPEFSVVMEPAELWPPNHKMAEVVPIFEVSDNCSSNIAIELIGISSDEGDEDDYSTEGGVYLRAERDGDGDGRVYILTYKAEDASGNISLGRAEVFVPHDQGQHFGGLEGDHNGDLCVNYFDLMESSGESDFVCLATDPLGTWNGIINSDTYGAGSGTITDWVLRCDGTTDGYWEMDIGGGFAISFNPSGNYTYSNCQLQFVCSGTATLSPGTGTSPYTLDVAGAISGDTASGSYQIYFDNWPNDSGTWQVGRELGTDWYDLQMLAANWLEVSCECSNDWCDGADLDYSTTIDLTDFSMLAQHWLEDQ